MTALLPPNLLRLFAPRPPLPYLKPLTKDTSDRGPDKLTGIAALVKRLRDEAEDAEYKQGLEETKKENGEDVKPKTEQDEKMAVDEDGAVKEEREGSPSKTKSKKRKDPIAEKGVIGQEAVKMRRELRKEQKEEYKKNADKFCECNWTTA